MSPLIVPAPMRIATVAATRTRLRSTARSSIGTATRRSTATNAKAEATATAKQNSTRGVGGGEDHAGPRLLIDGAVAEIEAELEVDEVAGEV
jgi:hypothetical protein